MPYSLSKDGKCVEKKLPDGSMKTMKCYDNHQQALDYLRALEINVKQSVITEMSMAITKASFDPKTETMRFRMVGSDVGPDVFGERMSLELFNDFVSRIETATPVAEPFKSILSEKSGWTGGMPYVSVAHYKSGIEGANIPADMEKVYVDGEKLKAVATCRDSVLGKAVYSALKDDLAGTSEYEDKIRVSIGFLDLKHSHGDFVFERNALENTCPMCENGVGDKVYLKGQLVHMALTRKPANPRTDTEVDMAKEIKTKQDDAESIVGKALTDELEINKSTTEEVEILTVKASDMPADHTGKADCTCKACADKKKDMPMKSDVVEPVVEPIAEVIAPVVEPEVVVPVEKSALDVAVDNLKLHIEQVKSLPRDEALVQLQPEFELVAKAVQGIFPEPVTVKTELSPELNTFLQEFKSILTDVSGKVATLSSEVTVLKGQVAVGGQPAKTEIPAPRNLQIERSITNPIFPDLANQKPMSIKELALRSVQAQ